jgi:nitroreductase
MIDTLNFMKHRRSVLARDMSGPAISADDLAEIVTIASRVPDHGKLAPWRFVHLNAEACAALAEVTQAISVKEGKDEHAAGEEAKRFLRAPTILCVISSPKPHPKIPAWEQYLSAGAACYGALIAAQAKGYAAQWLTGWVAYDAQIGAMLGLAVEEKIAGFINIGHCVKAPDDRPRPALGDIFSIGLVARSE